MFFFFYKVIKIQELSILHPKMQEKVELHEIKEFQKSAWERNKLLSQFS